MVMFFFELPSVYRTLNPIDGDTIIRSVSFLWASNTKGLISPRWSCVNCRLGLHVSNWVSSAFLIIQAPLQTILRIRMCLVIQVSRVRVLIWKERIHPLFAQDRFEDPPGLWKEIEASLRLASAILQTPASVAFLYSLMNQPHILLAADTQRLGQECTQFWPSSQPEHVMLEDFDRKLLLLSSIVSFNWLDNKVEREEKNTWAYTVCDVTPARLEMGAPGSGEKGFGSKISIGLIQTRQMIAIRGRTLGDFKNLSRLLRFQFMIAISLCHEVVHALGHAMWDSPSHLEPYYCDQRLNELGFAWETAVFGGTICDTFESKCFYPMITSTWPSVDGPANGLVELRGPKRRAKCYFVPMQYVNDIQQQAFWDQPLSDANLLTVPRLVGYRVVNKNAAEADFDPNWRSQDSSDVQRYTNAKKQIIKDECRAQ